MPSRTLRDELRHHIDALTSALASELESLIEERARQLVAERLGVGPNGVGRGSRPTKRARRARAGAAAKANGGSAAERIVSYVKSHPGARSEAVRAALGIGRGQWVYNVNKALASKAIKRKGVKRSSTLHPT